MKSGAAAPHSKTRCRNSTLDSRLRFGVRRCFGALVNCIRKRTDDRMQTSTLKMPKIPLMDYVGRPVLACVFLVLLLLQWRFPLRRQHFGVLHRLVRNFVLSIPGFAIARLAMLPIPIAVAIWEHERHIGLLNWLAFPGLAGGIATYLLKDYAYWWWHWAHHMVPVFW